jgi:transposase
MTTKQAENHRAALERRRLRAAAMFRKNLPQAEISRRLHVTPAAVCNWHARWREQCAEGLKSHGPPGPEPRLKPGDLRKVERSLLRGPQAFGYDTDYWTLPRIAGAIRTVTGVRYHPGHVWKVMQGMGWSCQKPVVRARERDEDAIERWIRDTFPGIQKKGDVWVLG